MADDVVLVHGWGGSFATTWESTGFTMLLEEAGKRVIGVDLLGHGTAPKPTDPAAYGSLGDRILDALPEAPCAAVGFSLGAITLARLAAEHPDRFERLVLAGIGGGTLTPDPDGHERIIRALEAPADALGDLDATGRLFRQYAEQPGNDLAALTAVMRRPAAAPLGEVDLSVVTCPVLIVIGDRDFSGPAEPLAERFPNATVTTLRNVDHFATTESFDFVDAVLRFVGAA
ncbi:alpha/beta fold hydrolase [Desertimonas flava]|uniref:alpha/beta fold hydrolase n=1 Tax=Desertimonas flava TaxID=2064846 RepID=UPI000E34D0D3|nr:alpha/beta hydrolase [Desertimonas flava]